MGAVQFAQVDGHHIAFREIVSQRESDHEIVMVGGAFWPIDSFGDDPIASRLVEGLSCIGRLIVFDRRGVAMSDPVSDWESSIIEQWADDLAAVIDAAGCDRPAVFSWHTAPIVPSFAIRYPDLVSKLVLFNPAAPVTDADNEWVAEAMGVGERVLSGGEHELRYQGFPGRNADPAFNEWNEAAGRVGASPAQARRMTQATYAAPFPDLANVRVPTMVVTRTPADYFVPAEFFQRAAAAIPDAQLEVLPQGDIAPVGVGVDDLLAVIGEYVTGEVRLPAPERQLTTILFTDLVDSTRRAATDGDAEWKRVLDRHDTVNSREVRRRGGEVIKSTGDGVLALLPSASAAVEAARAIRSGLAADDLAVRIGLHIGEIDRRGDDVSGLAVNTGARIMSIAAAGQILASELVSQVMDPSMFASIGSVALKGVDGDHELFVLT